jgi:hypothetical protein
MNLSSLASQAALIEFGNIERENRFLIEIKQIFSSQLWLSSIITIMVAGIQLLKA